MTWTHVMTKLIPVQVSMQMGSLLLKIEKMWEIEIIQTSTDNCRHQKIITHVAFSILSLWCCSHVMWHMPISMFKTCQTLVQSSLDWVELKCLLNALIRCTTPQRTLRPSEVLARTDDFQDWFEDNWDPGETFARPTWVTARDTPVDYRIDLLPEVVCQLTSEFTCGYIEYC
jgi:hypothetical protein